MISLILKENEEEITMKVKQTYSPEEKARMVLEGLTYPDGIAKYCRSNRNRSHCTGEKIC